MGKMLPNGTIISGNLPIAQNRPSFDVNEIYRGMVVRVNYVGDPSNITSNSPHPQVTYDVILLGGRHEGSIVDNARLMGMLGGESNYSERILRAASVPPDAKAPQNQDGDIVFLGFLGGSRSAPVILGCGTQPLDLDNTGATKSDGPRMRWEYNGVFFEINKNGEIKLIRKGGALNTTSNVFTPDSAGQKLQFEVTGQAISIDAESGTSMLFDGESDVVSVVTALGAKITINGGEDSVEVEDSAGGKLSIKAGKVALGSDVAELLQLMSDQMAEIITWANNVGALHTHLGNLGYPTLLPVETAGYLTLGTNIQAIKTLLDQIKGTL